MIALYTICVWLAWEPAWDLVLEEPVPAHYFFEDNLPGIVAFDPEMEVCQPEGEWDVPHVYSVAGFVTDAEGELLVGPESDSLTVVWLVPEPRQTLQLIAGIVCLVALVMFGRMWLDN